MIKLFAIFSVALILAYISERNTNAVLSSGQKYSVWNDWAYILLVVALILFTGLRTSYNDTYNYIRIFNQSPDLSTFLSDPDNFHPASNPLFYLILSLIKTFTNNSQIFIFLFSAFVEICFVHFIKRYSSNFLFSIFIYFTLGTFALSIAAIKQTTAMAILTLAIPFLEKKQCGRYYLIVLLAMLMHTYAVAFVVLPLFVRKPWRLFTIVFAAAMVFLMMNFETVIREFLEQADEMGKTIAEYEVFADGGVNILRLAVYAVVPLLSFIFQQWVFRNSSRVDHVMVHMSIISLAFMIMGTQSGANMFGRMANYFELGTVCCLPWILERTFDKRSYRLISLIACVCFIGFFVYGNAINISFDSEYRAVNLFGLLYG